MISELNIADSSREKKVKPITAKEIKSRPVLPGMAKSTTYPIHKTQTKKIYICISISYNCITFPKQLENHKLSNIYTVYPPSTTIDSNIAEKSKQEKRNPTHQQAEPGDRSEGSSH